MRLRINGKFWLVIGVLGGIAAAAAIILTTLLGGGNTDVATVNDIIETEAVTTVSGEKPDVKGNGAVAGLAAGADKAEGKKEEAKKETATEATTEAQTQAPTQAATQAPVQQQQATQRQTQAAAQPAKKTEAPKATQKATQPATTKASNSNADEFRGKEGAGNVDVGGEVKDYDSYVNNGIKKNQQSGEKKAEKEAWGGGQAEY